jgi:lipopolysaccharide exporter
MTENLTSKVVKGSSWVVFGSISGKGLDFLLQLLLTRLFVPEDFGIMAIGLSFIAIVEAITETGFGSAIIQKQNDVTSYLDSAWTLDFCKSILLFIIVLSFSNSIALFFNDIRIGPLLKILSITFIFRGAQNIGIIFFRKELLLKKQFLFELIPVIIQLIVIVPIAIFIRNYWVLVMGGLIKRGMELILSYLLHQYRPKLSFNIDKARSLYNFGKWIFIRGLIGTLMTNGISLFIGKYFGLNILGLFNRAELFSTVVFVLLIQIVWKVGYPAFSIIQRKTKKLWIEYNNLVQAIAFLSFPIVGINFLYGNDFLILFLSDEWSYSSSLVSILSIAGVLSLIKTPSSIILQSTGKPRESTVLTLVEFSLLAIFIIPFSIAFNITGLVMALIINRIIVLFLSWYMVYKIFNYNFGKLIVSISLYFVNTIITSSIIWLLRDFFSPQISIIVLCKLIIVYVVVYLALALIFEKIFGYGIIKIFQKKYNLLKI